METLTVEKRNHLSSAATRNADLMADELRILGNVTPELRAMVLDEELTHAAEIIAAQEMGYATVPRTYYQRGEDLIDVHDQSLKRVFSDGINYSRQELSQEIPGADWELRRRQAEFKNLGTILSMPNGTVCIEISPPPFDKPENERVAQNYNNLTMIRLSIKDGKVLQYNYALPISSPEFLRAVQTKLGRESEEWIVGSEEFLENPILQQIDQPAKLAAQKYDSLIGAALLEVSVGQSALRMVTRAIENRREAWEFVTAEDNIDVHLELLAAMERAAQLSPDARRRAMDAIRSGFWKEFKDRFRGNQQAVVEGGILMAAASRAVVDGDVFIACGSTVAATEFANSGNSVIGRAHIVDSLRKEVKGSGACSACGAKGSLYGCGLCQRCNKKWCDEYERSGKQTNIKDLAYRKYSRPEMLDKTESFGEYWQRIGREIRRKRELQKSREAKTVRLEETRLASAA